VVLDGLSDDLNTPLALTGVHAAADAVFAAEKEGDAAGLMVAIASLRAAGSLLGLLEHDPHVWFQGDGDEAIDALIEERNAARADKDFARADEIRDELDAQGIVLEDGAGGTTWRREN